MEAIPVYGGRELKQVWAPWRIEYIEGEKEKGCIFCNRLSQEKDRENLILFRGKRAFIIMNRFPYNSGHLMVAPNEHIGALEELPLEVVTEMMELVQKSMKVLKKVMNPHGFNIGVNQGKAAGAGVEDHVHIHIVPRWVGDTNFMTTLSEVRVIPEHLLSTYDKLKEHF